MPTPSHGKAIRHTWWAEPQALATMFWALSRVAVKSPQSPKTRGKPQPRYLKHNWKQTAKPCETEFTAPHFSCLQGGRPASSCPPSSHLSLTPGGHSESSAIKENSGAGRAVKLGLLPSWPGAACSAGKACRSQPPQAACAPSLPAKGTLPSGDWQGAGPLAACQESAPRQVPHAFKA